MNEQKPEFAIDLERHNLWRNRLWRLALVVIITLLSGLCGELYSYAFYDEAFGTSYRGFRTGASIGFVSAVIEIYYIRSVRRSWIRRVAFLPGLIVRILALTVIVRVGLKGNETLTYWLNGEPLIQQIQFANEVRDTLFSMLLVILFVIFSQLSTIIGWRRFTHLVFGRYFRPVVEERMFLMVDLVDSTRLARELGNVRFHELLSEFFHHIDMAIVRTGGEVVAYVGDAVIVTWPLTDNRRKNSRSLSALLHMIAHIRRRSGFFEKEFDVAPRFRAVLHCGEVVVGECGDSRRQITFLGDVLNMTGRMEALAKRKDVSFIASGEIVACMDPPRGVSFEPISNVQKQSDDLTLDLYRIVLQAPELRETQPGTAQQAAA